MNFQYGTWYVDEEKNQILDGQIKLMYGQTNKFGDYDLAEAMLRVEYTNKEINERQIHEEEQVNHKKKGFYLFSEGMHKRVKE